MKNGISKLGLTKMVRFRLIYIGERLMPANCVTCYYDILVACKLVSIDIASSETNVFKPRESRCHCLCLFCLRTSNGSNVGELDDSEIH